MDALVLSTLLFNGAGLVAVVVMTAAAYLPFGQPPHR